MVADLQTEQAKTTTIVRAVQSQVSRNGKEINAIKQDVHVIKEDVRTIVQKAVRKYPCKDALLSANRT